eukprot:gene3225-2207_t
MTGLLFGALGWITFKIVVFAFETFYSNCTSLVLAVCWIHCLLIDGDGYCNLFTLGVVFLLGLGSLGDYIIGKWSVKLLFVACDAIYFVNTFECKLVDLCDLIRVVYVKLFIRDGLQFDLVQVLLVFGWIVRCIWGICVLIAFEVLCGSVILLTDFAALWFGASIFREVLACCFVWITCCGMYLVYDVSWVTRVELLCGCLLSMYEFRLLLTLFDFYYYRCYIICVMAVVVFMKVNLTCSWYVVARGFACYVHSGFDSFVVWSVFSLCVMSSGALLWLLHDCLGLYTKWSVCFSYLIPCMGCMSNVAWVWGCLWRFGRCFYAILLNTIRRLIFDCVIVVAGGDTFAIDGLVICSESWFVAAIDALILLQPSIVLMICYAYMLDVFALTVDIGGSYGDYFSLYAVLCGVGIMKLCQYVEVFRSFVLVFVGYYNSMIIVLRVLLVGFNLLMLVTDVCAAAKLGSSILLKYYFAGVSFLAKTAYSDAANKLRWVVVASCARVFYIVGIVVV